MGGGESWGWSAHPGSFMNHPTQPISSTLGGNRFRSTEQETGKIPIPRGGGGNAPLPSQYLAFYSRDYIHIYFLYWPFFYWLYFSFLGRYFLFFLFPLPYFLFLFLFFLFYFISSSSLFSWPINSLSPPPLQILAINHFFPPPLPFLGWGKGALLQQRFQTFYQNLLASLHPRSLISFVHSEYHLSMWSSSIKVFAG